MASRYWVGGTGNWGDNTNHWAASSGGAPGVSLPTSTDDVFFDTNSGLSGGTITLFAPTNNAETNNFTSSVVASYTIAPSNRNLTIHGSATFESGLHFDDSVFPMNLLFTSSNIGNTITSNAAVFGLGQGIVFDFFGGTGSWILQDDLVIGGENGEIYLDTGTLDANGHNVTCHDVYIYADTGSNPTLKMGSGTWTITGDDTSAGTTWAIDENNGQTATIIPSTSSIKITNTNSATKTFGVLNGGVGKTYHNIWFSGSDTLKFTGSNTFADFKADNGPQNIQFTAGITTTVSTFTVAGTSGNLITIESATAAAHTLSASSGTISVLYCSIANSIATGGATWDAFTSNGNVDGGGNSGWVFSSMLQSQNAPLDINSRQGRIGLLKTDGSTIISVQFDPITHVMKVDDGTTGTDHGGARASIDNNGRQTVFGYSSANDGSLVAAYVDSSGKYLIQST